MRETLNNNGFPFHNSNRSALQHKILLTIKYNMSMSHLVKIRFINIKL